MNRLFPLLLIVLIIGCSNKEQTGLQFSPQGRSVPAFDADSAYQFIQDQVDFGPRVPNTYGHVETRKYLEQKFRQYAGSGGVFTQSFETPGYTGTLQLSNIIAAFNPTAQDRIVLSAHWDTRPRADEDTVRVADFIPGADDGGSGVGVLIELARIFSENPPPVGVDIVLFDGEDYGVQGDLDYYFLGSRHWSLNPPVPGYSPRFGILLDMVGAKEAQFPMEDYSMLYAPNLVRELWDIAAESGYQNLFLNQKGAAIQDDHYIVNQYTDIPMINIINHKFSAEGGSSVFGDHWHTHRDDMDIISKETLQAVGDVLLEFIYNRM